MRATRLATLALLFCHVGQCTISTFMLFSDLPSGAARSLGCRQPTIMPLLEPNAWSNNSHEETPDNKTRHDPSRAIREHAFSAPDTTGSILDHPRNKRQSCHRGESTAHT